MKKDVVVTVSGLHYEVDGGTEAESVEVVTPATYYLKNGKHYVLYDEVVEGMPGSIKNRIKLTGDSMLEMSKTGLSNTRMVFEKDKIHMTHYNTPFGEMLVGIHTRDIKVKEEEHQIEVLIDYGLDVDNEPLSDCHIKINIHETGSNS